MVRHLEPVDPYADLTNPTDNTPTDHDPDAEAALLGAAFNTPGILNGQTQHLYTPRHQIIAAAIQELADQDAPTNPIAIAARLRANGQLPRIGGAPYLVELAQSACTPSQADYYTRIITDHATARRLNAIATRIQQSLRQHTDPTHVETTAWAALSELLEPSQHSTGAPHTWTPSDLTEALAGHDDTITPTILTRTDGQSLVYPQAIHTISGEPESGKTWVALIATHQQLTAGHHVTYIDFEDRATRVIGRLLNIGTHPDSILKHLTYIRPHGPIDEHTKTQLGPTLTQSTLCVIDGVTEAMTTHGLELNDNSDIARFYDLLPRWITRHGPACILIDHVVKDTEKQGRWGIGGQHKLAGIDGAAYTVKVIKPFGRGKYGHARITLAKDREGQVAEYALGRTAAELHIDARDPAYSTFELRAPEAAPVDDEGHFRPTILMERVSRWLEAHPDSTTRAIKSSVTGKDGALDIAIQALINEGHIEVSPGIGRARNHRVVETFRNDPNATTEDWTT